jgi:hypothetical protein
VNANNVLYPLYGSRVHPWARGDANRGQRYLQYSHGRVRFFQLAEGQAPTQIFFHETPVGALALPPAHHKTTLQGLPQYPNSPRIAHLRKLDYPAGTLHFSQRAGELPTDILFTAKAIPLAKLPEVGHQFAPQAVAVANLPAAAI